MPVFRDTTRSTASAVVARPAANARTDVRGFTLLETLIVIVIIAVLLSILLPAMRAVRGQMRSLKCTSNLRSVTMRFQFFAAGESPEGRGDSDRRGRTNFSIGDFQESLYRIDEFWDLREASSGTLSSRDEVMLCPAGARQLTKSRSLPCSSGAIRPAADVSLAVNMRLYRATIEFMDRLVLAPSAATHVRADVLSHPHVPLLLDVDGQMAVASGVEPFYLAPPVRPVQDAYSEGRHWMPSKRHGGRTNVAFVGGHVLSSIRPENEPWDWAYQAEVGQ